jgi:glycosyltransferase involved in cell wall biosynthesis
MKKRILYLQYTNPGAYPPLEHSSQILANAGWKVLFLGTGGVGAGLLKFAPYCNVTVRQLAFCSAGFRQKLHYVAFCLWVLGWVIAWRPRWIYASDLLSCPIALPLSLFPGIRIVYHEHDSPSDGESGFMRFALGTRRLVAKRAWCVVLPNQTRAERLKSETATAASRIWCVWNCPGRHEIAGPRSAIGKDVWLLYHGSIVPARLPLSVLSALARLPESVKLRVIGYETVGSFGYLDTLRNTAHHLGILHRLDIRGVMPTRVELLQYGRQCDIGLALMPIGGTDANMVTMTGASNKPFDYLACGLALVVSDLPAWRSLYVDPGYGVACDPQDPASIERVLGALVKDPKRIREMGERGRRRIEEEWNYDTEFARVLDMLDAEPKLDLTGARHAPGQRVISNGAAHRR